MLLLVQGASVPARVVAVVDHERPPERRCSVEKFLQTVGILVCIHASRGSKATGPNTAALSTAQHSTWWMWAALVVRAHISGTVIGSCDAPSCTHRVLQAIFISNTHAKRRVCVCAPHALLQ